MLERAIGGHGTTDRPDILMRVFDTNLLPQLRSRGTVLSEMRQTLLLQSR